MVFNRDAYALFWLVGLFMQMPKAAMTPIKPVKAEKPINTKVVWKIGPDGYLRGEGG